MNDEFHGVGGLYLLDPKTGRRKLLERTDEKQPEPEPVEATTDDEKE